MCICVHVCMVCTSMAHMYKSTFRHGSPLLLCGFQGFKFRAPSLMKHLSNSHISLTNDLMKCTLILISVSSFMMLCYAFLIDVCEECILCTDVPFVRGTWKTFWSVVGAPQCSHTLGYFLVCLKPFGLAYTILVSLCYFPTKLSLLLILIHTFLEFWY